VDGLTGVWGSMKALGHWLYTNLVSFIQKIISFFEDLWDLLVGIWDVVKYLVAPVILMSVFGGVVKVFRSWTTRRGEGVAA
jgi:hypothetical protein